MLHSQPTDTSRSTWVPVNAILIGTERIAKGTKINKMKIILLIYWKMFGLLIILVFTLNFCTINKPQKMLNMK
jgi:hypothetical protein